MGKYSYENEFPLLQSLGLYASDILGDGNCLFNALSDQIFGDQHKHAEIRDRVVDYMRANKDHYAQFLGVLPGGAQRRNPKRKAAGALSSVDLAAPTQAEIDRQFENYLSTMGRGGTYGGNLEINAFSAAYNTDVKIYQADFAYMLSANGDDNGSRPVAHIAYHTWEHYSSIRNVDGPHNGLPHVSAKALSAEELEIQKQHQAKAVHVQPWMIKVVMSSLPYLADEYTIKKALEDSKGNVDAAVSRLLDAEDRGSVSSIQGSSSIEREDSDESTTSAPNKRLNLSQESLNSGSSQEPPHRFVIPDSDEDDWEAASSIRTGSVSASSRRNSPAPMPKLTLKLRQTRADRSPIRKASLKSKPTRKPAANRKAPTAREKKELKKQAQKQARKERAQATSKQSTAVPVDSCVPHKKGSPGLESGLKTLWI